MSNFIELYSGNRNRELYPLPSYFESPFAAVQQNVPTNAQDPVIQGTIYYTFTLYPPTTIYAMGGMQPGSSATAIFLDPNQSPEYSKVPNFYKGFTLVDTGSPTQEAHIIRSYDPSSGLVTFEKPFTAVSGGVYHLFIGFPTQDYIYIPTVDDNGNPIDPEEQAYTSYYVVFETPNPLYSNADNSNIFSRRISYYDTLEQIGYFDSPLPFSYDTVTEPQTFTLRKSLVLERWTLQSPSFFNYTPPTGENLLRGPLIGPVIQLPPSAPTQDNIWKGKYVYFASNAPDFYSPPLPPPSDLETPLPYVFYPIYGAYYIRAYNGQTKQLSVDKDIRNTPLPSYQLLSYSSASFDAVSGISSIANVGGTTYRAVLTPVGPGPTYESVMTLSLPQYYQVGRDYEWKWTLRTSATIVASSFAVNGVIDYYSPPLTTSYQQIVFTLSPTLAGVQITFTSTYNPADVVYVEWDEFQMIQVDTINITVFDRDNFSPLFYSGTMVGLNETVCYDVSLASLVIPNVPLRTGSSIAFYPFLYVLLENVTAPSGASSNIIYSNNPNTARALFVAACFPTPNPSIQRYITLSSSTSHTIKFKPNDNLRFAIYLGDGRLLENMVPDTLSPYAYMPRTQVLAVFSITRSSHSTK